MLGGLSCSLRKVIGRTTIVKPLIMYSVFNCLADTSHVLLQQLGLNNLQNVTRQKSFGWESDPLNHELGVLLCVCVCAQ